MTMTKNAKIGIVILIVCQIVLFIFAVLYLQNKTKEKENQLSQIYAKREDLLDTQQKIEIALSDINQSIVDEIERQKGLATVVEEITYIEPPIVEPTPPVTQPTYTPPVTTRAS